MNSDQLARLVGRSKATVDHWLVDPDKPSYQAPPKEIKDLLSTIHILWTIQSAMRDRMPRMATVIYEEVMAQREDEDR